MLTPTVWSQAEGLDWSYKTSVVGWVLSRDWLSRRLEVCDFCQAYRWSHRTYRRGAWTVPWLCICTLALHYNWGKMKGSWLISAEHDSFVDLAIVGNDLDCPAGPCCPWLSRQATGSTLVQRTYLPSYCTRGFPHQLTLSQSSQSGLWCWQTAEHPDHHVSACYLRTRGHQ